MKLSSLATGSTESCRTREDSTDTLRMTLADSQVLSGLNPALPCPLLRCSALPCSLASQSVHKINQRN